MTLYLTPDKKGLFDSGLYLFEVRKFKPDDSLENMAHGLNLFRGDVAKLKDGIYVEKLEGLHFYERVPIFGS